MDHGVLNVPLSKRGNIDTQIDRFKVQQASERRAAAQSKAAATKNDRAIAKALLVKAPEARIAELAARCKVTASAMRSRLASDAHWQPQLIIKLLAA